MEQISYPSNYAAASPAPENKGVVAATNVPFKDNGPAVISYPGHHFPQSETAHSSRDGSPRRNTPHDMVQRGQPGPLQYASNDFFSYPTATPDPTPPLYMPNNLESYGGLRLEQRVAALESTGVHCLERVGALESNGAHCLERVAALESNAAHYLDQIGHLGRDLYSMYQKFYDM